MKRPKVLISLVMIVFALGFVLWPLMRPGFYVSDDGEWMVIRLSAFYQSLADGQFPVRFLGRLNNSYGYPVANFLYPGFLYIGSLVHFLGLSFVTSVKFVFTVSVVGASFWIYSSLRRTFSSFAAGLGTLTFIGSPYLLYDLYTRGSVGEVLAFLPASVGIYSIIADKRWLFTLAVAGLIVSHNTLALLFLALFVVCILAVGRKGFLWPFLLGTGMAAFFWIPALVETRFVRFGNVTVSNPLEYMLRVETMWMVGVAGVVACLSLFFGKVRKFEKMTWIAIVLYIMSILLATPISGFIWSVRPVAALFQFPYRILSIGTLMAPWIVAAAAEKFIRKKVLVSSILFFILAVPAWYQLQNMSFVKREEGFYTTNEATTTVANEYMPKWVSVIPVSRASERLIFEKGRGTIVYEYLNTQRVVAHIDAPEESLMRLQTVYYPGWGITLDDNPARVTYANPNGFMEFAVPAGKHTIVAEFRETIPRFIADIVSVGSFIAWLIFVMKAIKYP